MFPKVMIALLIYLHRRRPGLFQHRKPHGLLHIADLRIMKADCSVLCTPAIAAVRGFARAESPRIALYSVLSQSYPNSQSGLSSYLLIWVSVSSAYTVLRASTHSVCALRLGFHERFALKIIHFLFFCGEK